MSRTLREGAARFVVAAVLTVPSAGCLVSTFHPLYDDASVIVDEGLAGTWQSSDSDATAIVSRSEWRSYEIAFTERSNTTRFTAFLTEVNGARFLTVRPIDGEERAPFVVATNGPLQIVRDGNRVRVRALDYDEVTKRLAAGTLGVAANDLKQNVVITAATPALRQWIASIPPDSTLWAEWRELSRQ